MCQSVRVSQCHPALRRHISRIVAKIPQHYDKRDNTDPYSVTSHPRAIVSPFHRCLSIIQKILWRKQPMLFRNEKNTQRMEILCSVLFHCTNLNFFSFSKCFYLTQPYAVSFMIINQKINSEKYPTIVLTKNNTQTLIFV